MNEKNVVNKLEAEVRKEGMDGEEYVVYGGLGKQWAPGPTKGKTARAIRATCASGKREVPNDRGRQRERPKAVPYVDLHEPKPREVPLRK